MASQLNSYRNFIDIKTKEGQALVSNAIDRFTSPLVGDDRIALIGPDFQKFKDNISRHCSLYGYDYLFKRCAITCVVIPSIEVNDNSGIEEEIDGLTVLALILSRIRPNFKVHMYAEITKVKKLTIAQYDNDVQLYFDAVQFLKLHINQKDPTAYTEDAYIRDIFLQLKHESLPADF
jgi:hypothetical protein